MKAQTESTLNWAQIAKKSVWPQMYIIMVLKYIET